MMYKQLVMEVISPCIKRLMMLMAITVGSLFSDKAIHLYKVGPPWPRNRQAGVHITTISLWFMVFITNWSLGFINQSSHHWGGATL